MKIVYILIGLLFLTAISGCTNTEAGPAGSGTDTAKTVSVKTTAETPIITDYPSDLKVEGPSRFDATALSAVWTEPEINGEMVSIPVELVEKYWIVNFQMTINGKNVPLMAVKTTDGKINIMPRICVPCRSEGWHLKDDVLICDACGTTFDAKSGDGIQGACKDFPKALIPYTTDEGKFTMTIADIADAYTKTLKPGWP